MTILYTVGKKIYVNITNRCPCNCTFCIRNNGDGAYGSDSLWLEHEPSFEEVVAEFSKYNLSDFVEIVFCGFGEPLERIEDVSRLGKYLKTITKTPIRINTNGLSDLIHEKPTASLLDGAIDIVSISLNAGTKAGYLEVTRPSFGEKSFDAMLKFAEDCKKFVPNVMFTVVDVISKEEISSCKEISEKLGIPLRIRKYDA
ncbi:MAG: TIGR04100 family radical SAM protein [Oscillospiraceae bacterium]